MSANSASGCSIVSNTVALRSVWRASVLIASAAVLSGCAAMNKRECQLGDWHTVGFDDGARGAPLTRVADYSKACAKYSVRPDLSAYRSGYDLGLDTYCRDSNGFAVGSAGASYEGVCPAQLEPQFLNGYRTGHQLFELQLAVSNVGSELSQRQSMLREVEEHLAVTEAAIISDGTPAEQRALLLVKVAELSEREGELKAEIIGLERNLAVRQEDFRRFRESLAYNR
jgi:hypothetical protein